MKNIKYLSVCSGIEAATVAWHSLGWEAAGFCEIEKFPSEVLKHHYPNVTNFGDMTKYKEWNLGTIELLVGGTPCQSFSVAGLRKGLEDPRGNLMLTYCGLLDHFKPKWFVWENVPGVLSSSGGRDFGSFLGAVAELGYGWSYRVLDAQYFGVAQRRRRVFVVGCLGDWKSAAKVLFEPESLRRDTPPSRKQRKEIARNSTDSVGALCARDFKGVGNQYVSEGKCIVEPRDPQVAGTITARFGASRNNHEECVVYENHPSDSRVKLMGEVCQTITSKWGTGGGNTPLVSYSLQGSGSTSQNSNGFGINEEISFTLNSTDHHGVAQPIPLNTMNLLGRDKEDNRRGFGIGNPGDPCPTLTKAHSHGVAYSFAENSRSEVRLEGGNGSRTGALSTGGGKPGQGVPMIVQAFDTYNHSLSDVNQTIKSPQSGVNESIGTVLQPTVLMDQGGSVMNVSQDGIVGTLRRETHGHEPSIIQNMAVRRLTPVECERLQGFPDNYTDIKPKGKDTPDGPRYKALGNSMAVPVMAWIGKRIQMVENQQNI